MASLVYLSTANERARDVDALESINSGIAKLQELNGLRAECIAVSAATVASVFGVADDTQAQALSDRWNNFLLAFADSGNVQYALLRDLVNAVIHS